MTERWLDLSPDWFPWYLLVLTLFSVWVSLWSYRKVRPALPPSFSLLLIALRSLVLILLGALAVHPVIRLSDSSTTYPPVTIWIDQSASMDKWWNESTRSEMIERLRNLAGDSVSLSLRYFGTTVSDFPDSSSAMTKQTRLTPVVKSAKNGLNVLVTDGRFDDQDWFFSTPTGQWDAWIIGDTTQPVGFFLQPLSREQVTGFTGDTLRLPLNVTWRSVSSDSVRVVWTGGVSGASEWISPESGSGNRLVLLPLVGQTPGNVMIQVRLEGTGAIGSKTETIRFAVRERFRDVWILAHEPQPLIGFLHRQAVAAGAKDVRVFYDSKETTPSGFASGPPAGFFGLIMAVNYPSLDSKGIYRFQSLTAKNPVLLVSSVPLMTTAIPEWVPPFRILPEPFNRKPWLPAPIDGKPGVLAGWSDAEITRMPPHQTPLMAVPAFRSESARMSVAGTVLDFPVAWSGTGLPKRVWLAAGAWDEWDRLEALNGRSPSAISSGFRTVIRDLLTPAEEDPFSVSFQPIGNGSDLLITVVLNPDRIAMPADSLVAWLTPDGQPDIRLTPETKTTFQTTVRQPAAGIFSWKVRVVHPDGRTDRVSGTFQTGNLNSESTIGYASAEPFRTWASGSGGQTHTGLPDDEKIKERLNSLAKQEIRSSVLDSWDQVGIFLLILILLTTEWIIRKRLGAL